MIARLLSITAASIAAASVLGASAEAAGGKTAPLKHEHWHFSGVFGTYDKDAVQRGFQVYETVCSNCHGVALLSFRNLGQKGGPFDVAVCTEEGSDKRILCDDPNQNPIVKAIAAKYKYQITDGPDDSGDMFQRAAIPSDPIPGPYANDNQARAANGGALPPDLSLIAKARHHGPDYIYSLLTGYRPSPDGVVVPAGQHYNVYFPGDMLQLAKREMLDEDGHPIEGFETPLGGVLAMAPPLSDGVVDYTDETAPETVEQYARDVVEFLAWASEPKMEARKRLGVMTLGYLIILTILLYWSYREIWSKTEH